MDAQYMSGERQVRFPYFSQADKMSTLADCDQSCIHNVIPRANTKKLHKVMHSKTLQINRIGTLKYSSNHRKARKRRKMKNREQKTKYKIADISPKQ